jgi:hypothetical protein
MTDHELQLKAVAPRCDAPVRRMSYSPAFDFAQDAAL